MDTHPPERISRTPLVPPCPKCHRIDKADEEETPDESAQRFVCTRCGTHYVAPPRQ